MNSSVVSHGASGAMSRARSFVICPLSTVSMHTFSSASYHSFRVNDKTVSEGGLNAMIAGYYGVPVVLISGDESAIADLKAVAPDAEGAIIKHSISFHSAATATPAASQALIKLRVKAALSRIGTIKPVAKVSPVTIDLTFSESVRRDPAWAGVRAVKAGRVHLSPKIPFGWVDFPPSVNRMVGLWWLAKLLYPQAFPEDIRAIARDFHTLFYQVTPSEPQLDRILAGRG